MNSYVYVGDYNFNLFAASLLRKGRSGKDYFYNTDQKHLTLKYQLNEIKNLNSLDELMSISYSKVIITSVNSSNLISALLGMGIFDFSVMNYRAYPASEKRSALEFIMGTPSFYDEKITDIYWDLRADDIHESWGDDTFDYTALSEVINYVKPLSILDIGCGSGRLFQLYSRFKIEEIVGQDISKMALNIAATRNLPHVHLLNCKIEELKYDLKHFDLIISNKVMAAIPDGSISSVIDKLCYLGKHIYINELLPEEEKNNAGKCPYFIAHDYELLFQLRGYKIDSTGNIDYKMADSSIVNQKWFLFKDSQHIHQ